MLDSAAELAFGNDAGNGLEGEEAAKGATGTDGDSGQTRTDRWNEAIAIRRRGRLAGQKGLFRAAKKKQASAEANTVSLMLLARSAATR